MSYLDNFRRAVPLFALRVPNAMVERVLKPLRGHSLKRSGLKAVIEDPADPSKRLMLLDEAITPDNVPELVAAAINEHVQLVPYTVQLQADNYTLPELLRAVIPEPLDLPAAYECVGHIAHLNLRNEVLPYKRAIGEAILAKVKHIKTVVNKLQTVHAVYRTFDMEVLAGEERFDVEVLECNCRFRFNYREVYWNSRLQEEHRRIIDSCVAGTVVCDMFAGVGPFVVPIAKRGCRALANDLNPASYAALLANAKLNKVAASIECFNMDARDFVRHVCAGKTRFPFQVVVMNLPKDAVEFLDVFVGIMPELEPDAPLPTIHCYAFCKPESEDLRACVLRALDVADGDDGDAIALEIRKVRDISPKKFMFCVTFVLPRSVATATRKRRRLEDNAAGAKQ